MDISMQAVTFSRVRRPGRAAAPRDVERPEPGPDDVLVRIHAAGICYHDVLSRGGKIPGGQPGRILGHEIAGEIVAGGAKCRQRAHRRTRGALSASVLRQLPLLPARPPGSLPEQPGARRGAAAAAMRNSPASRRATRFAMPDGLDMTAAALAVCPVGTSVRAALGVAAAEPGRPCLITGAGGGLGLHQIQVAKSVQARVDRGHELGGEGRRSCGRLAPTRSSSART